MKLFISFRNENACWGPAGCTPLTRENLQNMTYQMSFKYGSATKAVREIPVSGHIVDWFIDLSRFRFTNIIWYYHRYYSIYLDH